MANNPVVQIQNLTAADTPLIPTSDLMIVSQGGIARKVTVANSFPIAQFTSVPYTGGVPEANLQAEGIFVAGPVRETKISNSVINTSGLRAIRLNVTSTAITNLGFDGVEISNNRIVNFANIGVSLNAPATGSYQRVLVKDNVFDADPSFTNINRGSNGTWSRLAYPYGLNARNFAGLDLKRNQFRNMTAPVIYTGGTALIHDNFVFATAAAVGFSTSNVGVGYIDRNGPDWTTIQEDSNPNSATYGKMLSANYDNATTIPSSGCWVAGRVVANASASVSSSGILASWKRLTTSCNNVSGTDWVPMYTKTVWP